MISQSAHSVVIVAEMLRRNGYCIAPISNVPLTQLASDCFGIGRVDPSQSDTHIDLVTKAHELTANAASCDENIQSMGDHELHMVKSAEALASILRSNLQIVRGTVRPMIESVVNATSEALAGLANVAVTTPIVEDLLHPIYDEPMVREILKPSVHVYADFPPVGFFEVLDLPQITALMMTSMARVDEMVTDLVNRVGGERILNIYAAFFPSVYVSNDGSPVMGLDQFVRDDFTIAALIARGLMKDIENNASGTRASAETIERSLLDLVEQLKLRIWRSVKEYEDSAMSGRLVISYPDRLVSSKDEVASPILVNGLVYREWLSEQGSPEILYGAMLTDRVATAVHLLENREKYQQACNRYLNDIGQLNESNREAVIRQNLVNGALAYIQNTETINGFTGNRDLLPEAFRNFADRLYLVDIDRLYEAAKSMICKLMFADTYAEEIIDYMFRHEGEGSDLSAEEHLANSVMDLVTRAVVFGQTIVKPVAHV